MSERKTLQHEARGRILHFSESLLRYAQLCDGVSPDYRRTVEGTELSLILGPAMSVPTLHVTRFPNRVKTVLLSTQTHIPVCYYNYLTMSLQGLVSGSECALPHNPLAQVLKHTEGDRSVQKVRTSRGRLRSQLLN